MIDLEVQLNSNNEMTIYNVPDSTQITGDADQNDSMLTTDSSNMNSRESHNALNCRQRSANYRRRQRRENLLPYDSLINLNDIAEHYGGEMIEQCIHCKAHFKCEKVANKENSFNDCCTHGKVRLEPLPELPIELRSLFDSSHRKSNIFFSHIFASFNANLMNLNASRSAPFCFRIQGQIYYQINTALYPGPNELPAYGQLFIIDSEEAVNLTMHNNLLDRNILEIVDHVIRRDNKFAQSYEMMGEE